MVRIISRRQALPAMAMAIAAMSLPAILSARTIVSDTWTATTTTAIPASTPDFGPAGATWAQNGYAGYQDNFISNAATLGADAGNGISLSGVTATNLTLTDSFNLTNDTNSSQNANYSAKSGHGTGLGFYSAIGTTNHGWDNFTGLSVTADG